MLQAYIRWELRRHFDQIRLFGERAEFSQETAYPLVFFSTHQSWWDGFLEIPLKRRYSQNFWLMMEERNLRRFPAFRWLGVFGVDLEQPAGRSASLLYAARRLKEPGRSALYVYPHGKLVPPHAPWPAFQGGVAELLRLVPAARAVPVAKELVHGAFRDPIAYLELGEPLRGSVAELEAALRATQTLLRERLARAETGVELLAPKRWATGRT